MKTWQYLIFIGVGIVLLLAILYFIPGTSHLVRGVLAVLKWIWMATSGLVLATLVIGFGALMGWLFKAFCIAFLDSKLEKRNKITTGMHWGIAIVFGLICGVMQAWLMPIVMGWNSWVRGFAIHALGWSGVFETLSIIWLFYGSILFVIAYMRSGYEIKPRYGEED